MRKESSSPLFHSLNTCRGGERGGERGGGRGGRGEGEKGQVGDEERGERQRET